MFLSCPPRGWESGYAPALRDVQFQNFNHHHKGEDVYFHTVLINSFWLGTQSSFILEEYETCSHKMRDKSPGN